MPYDVPVRSYLASKGVSNADIGFDKNSGNVTLKGQNFYKPELNMAGSAYSTRQNLDNAYGAYQKQQAAPVTGTPTETTTEAPKKEAYTNPYSQLLMDTIKHLSDKAAVLQQPTDIYSTPQYAAARANQDRQSQNAVRHANEAAAGAGLGHSTVMTDRSQGIQNDSDNYLATQLVPQIMSQIQAQKQQDYQNEQNQFRNIYDLSNQADSQHNSDRTFDYNANQDTITNNRNADTDTYSHGQDKITNDRNAATDTHNKEQDKIKNEHDHAILTGFMADGTPTNAKQQQDLTNAWAQAEQLGTVTKTLSKLTGIPVGTQTRQAKQDAIQNRISQQSADASTKNANTSAANSTNSNENAQQDNLMNIWKATGKAPAGIQGVAEGTAYAGQTAPKPVVVDPKLSTEAYTNYKDQIDNSTYTKYQKLAFAASVKDEMTPADYDKLVKGIK